MSFQFSENPTGLWIGTPSGSAHVTAGLADHRNEHLPDTNHTLRFFGSQIDHVHGVDTKSTLNQHIFNTESTKSQHRVDMPNLRKFLNFIRFANTTVKRAYVFDIFIAKKNRPSMVPMLSSDGLHNWIILKVRTPPQKINPCLVFAPCSVFSVCEVTLQNADAFFSTIKGPRHVDSCAWCSCQANDGNTLQLFSIVRVILANWSMYEEWVGFTYFHTPPLDMELEILVQLQKKIFRRLQTLNPKSAVWICIHSSNQWNSSHEAMHVLDIGSKTFGSLIWSSVSMPPPHPLEKCSDLLNHHRRKSFWVWSWSGVQHCHDCTLDLTSFRPSLSCQAMFWSNLRFSIRVVAPPAREAWTCSSSVGDSCGHIHHHVCGALGI